MTKLTRRDFLISTAGITAAASMGNHAFAAAPGELIYKPEEGAKLRVLRWKRFVQGDEDLWNANTKKFTEKTGVEVRIDAEGWEDVRPKAAVAANIGSGPDIIIGWFDDPHQYPDKLLDLSELAN
jgi:multiple sugar transport system substrate-binding protein